jgi:thiol:disulfide interchange protein
MKFSSRIIWIWISLTIFVCASSVAGQKTVTASKSELLSATTPAPDLYPADADAKKEIGAAIKVAAAEHKRVLLIFGANWCYDCHVLNKGLHDGEAGRIVSQSFVLVHVDIGEGEKNPDLVKEYKIPLDKGVPAVAVLDSNGRLLFSSGDGEFEAARRMLKRYLVDFLKKWKPKRS